jgi:hypothetical protein
MAAAHWTVSAASVRGRGHEQTGAPCQDSSAAIVSPNGKWVALVASDGAGTARRSEIGANFVAREFAMCLLRLSEECDRRAPGAWVSDRVIQDIVLIRDRLRANAGSDDISEFHCTLVAALIGPTGGLTVHLGDGAIFGGAAEGRAGDVIDLAREYFVSLPQNGEYSNETVFLTERDWVKNLRIHPLAAADWVMLGTDGGISLAMVGESKPKSGFVIPVIRALIKEGDFPERCEALARILDDRQADRLTNDDKTLVAAIRSQFRDVTGEFEFIAEQSPSLSSLERSVPQLSSAQSVLSAQSNSSTRLQKPAIAFGEYSRHSHGYRPSRGWLLWSVSGLLLIAVFAVAIWLLLPRLRGTTDTPASVVPLPKLAPSTAEPERGQAPSKPTTTATEQAPSTPKDNVGATGSMTSATTTAPNVPTPIGDKQHYPDTQEPKSGK